MDQPVSGIRREYSARGFSEAAADPDPLKQFDMWFDEAVKCGLLDPSAMSLATVDAEGQPAVRTVLLKGFGARGFVFYTNYDSPKARALTANPRAAACFWWDAMDRQVRFEGAVERLSADESDAYFASRPREAQIAACASRQSQPIADRSALINRVRKLTAEFHGRDVSRPSNWGGFRIIPDMFEFWQGREQRLHDRIRYTRDADGAWVFERLCP